jgi:hypothetical protein
VRDWNARKHVDNLSRLESLDIRGVVSKLQAFAHETLQAVLLKFGIAAAVSGIPST